MPAPDESTRFGPDRTAVFPVLVLLVCALPLALSDVLLLPVLLLPLACLAWVLRARVVVRPDGLEVSNGAAAHRVPWDRVEGFDASGRGPVRLLEGGRRRMLTALPRRHLRGLLEAANAAQGRTA